MISTNRYINKDINLVWIIHRIGNIARTYVRKNHWVPTNGMFPFFLHPLAGLCIQNPAWTGSVGTVGSFSLAKSCNVFSVIDLELLLFYASRVAIFEARWDTPKTWWNRTTNWRTVYWWWHGRGELGCPEKDISLCLKITWLLAPRIEGVCFMAAPFSQSEHPWTSVII